MSKTVKESIVELSQFPPEAEVVMNGPENFGGNMWRSYARSIHKVRFRKVTDGKIPQRPCAVTGEGELKVIIY